MFGILKKLTHILNRGQKRRVMWLGVMIFIGALLEMLGVGLIMPVVEGVMSPERLVEKDYIRLLGKFLPYDTPSEWMLVLIFAVMAASFVKNAYLLLQIWVQSRFVNKNQSATISYML